MYDHKEDVINTRKGCLGGSDAKMIAQIVENGSIPKSAMKRLAVCKGLIEHENFTNKYMEMGNFIEDAIYQNLVSVDPRWQSNPCLVSKKFSRPNVKIIDHVDYMLQDDEKKVLTIGECKSTRLDFKQTKEEYMWQLRHHWLLASEYAKELGGYKVVLQLVHYFTEGLELDEPFEFDPSRLTVKTLKGMEKEVKNYNLSQGADMIDEFLETFNEYYEDDEVPYEYLPANVKTQFDQIAVALAEIKEREDKVAQFKEKLYEFLVQKNVKGIRSDVWSITRVDATETSSFDAKKFLEEYTKEHPTLASRLKKKYNKVAKRKGYVTIKLK